MTYCSSRQPPVPSGSFASYDIFQSPRGDTASPTPGSIFGNLRNWPIDLEEATGQPALAQNFNFQLTDVLRDAELSHESSMQFQGDPFLHSDGSATSPFEKSNWSSQDPIDNATFDLRLLEKISSIVPLCNLEGSPLDLNTNDARDKADLHGLIHKNGDKYSNQSATLPRDTGSSPNRPTPTDVTLSPASPDECEIIFVDNADKASAARARNTLAARKYRKTKMTRVQALEKALKKAELERDHWRMEAERSQSLLSRIMEQTKERNAHHRADDHPEV